ncbi:hypothetical protein JB92DRAFT_3048184, partial [Gautieria morchelliformis]
MIGERACGPCERCAGSRTLEPSRAVQELGRVRSHAEVVDKAKFARVCCTCQGEIAPES